MKALNPASDAGLTVGGAGDDDDGDEFEPIGDDEGEERDEEEEDEMEVSGRGGGRDDGRRGDPSTELVSSVRAALGPLCVKEVGGEESDVASDLDDDAMERLDSALSAAFKAHLGGRMTARAEKVERLEFRMRLCDLLLVLLNAPQPQSHLVLACLPQLLAIANAAIRAKDAKPVFDKVHVLLLRINKHLRFTLDDETALRNCAEEILSLSTRMGNPQLQLILGDSLASLVSWSGPEQTRVLMECLESAMQAYFRLHSPARYAPAVFSVPISKHPLKLLPLLPVLGQAALGPAKFFRKSEGLRWARSFFRKVGEADAKAWRKSTKRFLRTFLPALVQELGEKTTELGEREETKEAAGRSIYRTELLVLLRFLLDASIGLPLDEVLGRGGWGVRGLLEGVKAEGAWKEKGRLASVAGVLKRKGQKKGPAMVEKMLADLTKWEAKMKK